MDHADVEQLRDRHPAWRLLRADDASLVLAFLGRHFAEQNNGATASSGLAASLGDELRALNASDDGTARYAKAPGDYLADWARAGWLRELYPPGSDEVHYDATPALEQACAWMRGLVSGPDAGTEPRLHTRNNRRVLELTGAIEAAASSCRDDPAELGLEVDEPGISIALPFERPLYDARPPAARADSLISPEAAADTDMSVLVSQSFAPARLAGNIRSAVPAGSSALLSDILASCPVEHGAAEIIGYLALTGEHLQISVDDQDETVIDYTRDGLARRMRMPAVTVTRQ